MSLHITDLPLEAVEIALIVALAIGLLLQSRSLRKSRSEYEKMLGDSSRELKHLRKLIDKILLVDKGYIKPSEDIDSEESSDSSARRPSKLH